MQEPVLDQLSQVETEPFRGGYFPGEQRQLALAERLHAGQREKDVVDVPGDVNNIFLALPRVQPLGQGELALLARKISTAKRFRFDLGELVEYGFLHAREKNPQARVLRDADPR